MPKEKYKDHILLFDGVCNLCNHSVQFLIRHDKKEILKFASLQSEAGQRILKENKLPDRNFDTFVFVKGNRVFLRSDAWLEVMKVIGGGWKFFYAFKIVPRPIRDFVYNRIARSRYRLFGKKEFCMIPSPDLQKRFLPD